MTFLAGNLVVYIVLKGLEPVWDDKSTSPSIAFHKEGALLFSQPPFGGLLGRRETRRGSR